jgi:hypothetical protein
MVDENMLWHIQEGGEMCLDNEMAAHPPCFFHLF